MDRRGGSSLEVNSFHNGEDQHVNSPDSGKKRKLQYEQVGLPISKHKFRERCGSPAQGIFDLSHLERNEIFEESSNFCKIILRPHDGPAPSEGSSNDSNSFLAGDDEAQTEMSSETSSLVYGTFTSSGRLHENSNFTSKLYSLDSRVTQSAADPREGYSDLEDEIQVEPEFEETGGQLPLPLPGSLADYIEEYPDAAIEELMLYSNDVAPNAFPHPSEGWGLKQDLRLTSRKPTIDQEFEQYFSMLML